MNKKYLPYITLALAGIFLVVSCTYSHLNNKKVAAINSQITTKKTIQRNLEAKLANPTLNKQMDTPELKATQEQLKQSRDMYATTDGFFNVVFNFNSQKAWNARKKKASVYATDAVLNNKRLFNSGKDITGHSIIEAQKQNSTYNGAKLASFTVDNNHIMTGIAKVTYSASIEDSSSSQKTDVYLVSYDTQQHKLTSVQRVGELNDEE